MQFAFHVETATILIQNPTTQALPEHCLRTEPNMAQVPQDAAPLPPTKVINKWELYIQLTPQLNQSLALHKFLSTSRSRL